MPIDIPKMCINSEGILTLRNSVEEKSSNAFRWNDLSGEIKNRIYDYALTEAKPIRLHVDLDGTVNPIFRDDDPIRRAIVPNLLLINKQTYSEGAPLLYHNHLSFCDPETLYYFFKRLSPQTKQLVETISVRLWHQLFLPSDGVFTQLIGASNLQMVRIKEMMPLDGPLLTAKALCNEPGMRGWVMSLGQDHAQRAAALDRLLRFREKRTLFPVRFTRSKRNGVMEYTAWTDEEMEEWRQKVEREFRRMIKAHLGLILS
ncbi:hypothetical protein SLS56_006172 [Neofusicoccum ribis]|uniref:Uncharacterized protein n=1 Tax=Neofusicoccum ribis TaxID=45134 RepID=A0ABR3SRG7_9PEZI